jgi:TatA/E family protein of Tat protein translocase
VFGLSFWEIAIILVVALIVLGPSKLPELARGLGKGIREFRRATEDFKTTVDAEMNRPDPPRPARLPEAQAELLPPAPSPSADPGAPRPAADAVPREP